MTFAKMKRREEKLKLSRMKMKISLNMTNNHKMIKNLAT